VSEQITVELCRWSSNGLVSTVVPPVCRNLGAPVPRQRIGLPCEEKIFTCNYHDNATCTRQTKREGSYLCSTQCEGYEPLESITYQPRNGSCCE
jgi:hypothetical protein